MVGKGIFKKLQVSKTLQAVIKANNITRGEVMKKLWAYAAKNGLKDPKDGRIIHPDDLLTAVFESSEAISMSEIPGKLKKHLT